MSVKDELKLYHDTLVALLASQPNPREAMTISQLRAMFLISWRAVEADRVRRYIEWVDTIVTPVVKAGLKTRHELVVTFGATGCPQHTVTVPAGTRCILTDNPNEVFVDDLSWLDSNSMAYHDAVHRGIRLDRSKVTHES